MITQLQSLSDGRQHRISPAVGAGLGAKRSDLLYEVVTVVRLYTKYFHIIGIRPPTNPYARNSLRSRMNQPPGGDLILRSTKRLEPERNASSRARDNDSMAEWRIYRSIDTTIYPRSYPKRRFGRGSDKFRLHELMQSLRFSML